MEYDLVIKNRKVVTPNWVISGEIAVKGEKIAAIGDKDSFQEAKKIVDAEGKIVLPGGIDTHSHIELSFMGAQPPETWEQATIATAIGGTTTTIDFASLTGLSTLSVTSIIYPFNSRSSLKIILVKIIPKIL